MQNFVVARTSLHHACTDNKVSLAYYNFETDSTLSAEYWIWAQANPAPRVQSGATPDASCTGAEAHARACPMLVPQGWFQKGAGASGHYDFNEAGQLQINWGSGIDEIWTLTRSFDDTAGTYVTFALASGTHFNYGIMFGSNAPFSSNAPLGAIAGVQDQPFAWIRAQPNDPVSFQWNVIGAGWSADTGPYTACASSPFLTARHDCTGLGYCECGSDPNHWSSGYVHQGGDRCDAWNHWCECLTSGALCYEGNSHVKPMMQAVDSNGNWVGWIGVEASFYPKAGNPGGDMLGLFAIGEATVHAFGAGAASLKTNYTAIV